MSNDDQINLNYALDAQGATLERVIKRLWVLCIILILALILTNGVWFYYDSQFEDVTVTQEAHTDDGGTAVVNNGGDLNYGNSETDN